MQRCTLMSQTASPTPSRADPSSENAFYNSLMASTSWCFLHQMTCGQSCKSWMIVGDCFSKIEIVELQEDLASIFSEDTEFFGFLPQSFSKTFKNSSFQFSQSIISDAPSFDQLHSIVSIFCIFQFIALVFFPMHGTFCKKDSPFLLSLFDRKSSLHSTSIDIVFILCVFVLISIFSLCFAKCWFHSKNLSTVIIFLQLTFGFSFFQWSHRFWLWLCSLPASTLLK